MNHAEKTLRAMRAAADALEAFAVSSDPTDRRRSCLLYQQQRGAYVLADRELSRECGVLPCRPLGDPE